MMCFGVVTADILPTPKDIFGKCLGTRFLRLAGMAHFNGMGPPDAITGQHVEP